MQARRRGSRAIAGVDEAGRGPLAGPVVAAAVILPEDFCAHGVRDSKQLSSSARDEAFARLTGDPRVAYGVGLVEPDVIDRINIYQATLRAMSEAIRALPTTPDCCLIDALTLRDLPTVQVPIIHGDALSVSIAAASIVAKVTRDRLMTDCDRMWPNYGFARHKGYATAQHLAALGQYGPCPIHRRSFSPIKDMLADFFLP